MPKERKRGRYALDVAPYFGGPFPKEMKYFDCQFDGSVSSAANWTTAVIPMAQYMSSDGATAAAYTAAALIPSANGNGYGQVVGNKYLLKKLKIRGTFICPPNSFGSATAVPCRMRWLVVQDNQANGAQASAADFMTDWGSAAEMIDSYMSISSGSGGRFQILADERFMFDSTAMVASLVGTYGCAFQGKLFEFTRSWKDGLEVVIKSGAATPAITALSGVNIFMCAISYNETAGAQSFLHRGMSRAVYCDY